MKFDPEVNRGRGSGNEKHSVTKHVEVNTFCEVGEEAVEEEKPIEIGQEALAEGEVDQVFAVMNEELMETSEACSVQVLFWQKNFQQLQEPLQWMKKQALQQQEIPQ